MSPELISILVLVAMFAIATVLPINMGALSFVAAFLVGTTVAGLTSDEILGGFPGSLVVTLIGITYLFAIAQANGTIDWLVQLAVRAVRGRLLAIPWIMFGAAALLTAFGALSPAAVAIMAPIALGFAYQHQISPLLMGLVVVFGAQAGGFSPISVYGSIVNNITRDAGLERSPLVLFLASLAFNLLVALVAFTVLGGRDLAGRGRVGGGRGSRDPLEEDVRGVGTAVGRAQASPDTSPTTASPVPDRSPAAGGPAAGAVPAATAASGATATVTAAPPAPGDAAAPAGATPYRVLTLVGLVALGVTTLFGDRLFGEAPNVGLVAITVAVVLALVSPTAQKGAVAKISWPTVLLIAGVLTYVFVLEEIGTVSYVSDAVADLGAPLLAALLLCYVGAVVSAFASSTALLGALIPLAVPFLLAGDVGAIGMIAALSVSSTVVDVSPFSTNGALVLASAAEEGKDAFYQRLLVVGALVVVVAPVATWLLLVVPGWL